MSDSSLSSLSLSIGSNDSLVNQNGLNVPDTGPPSSSNGRDIAFAEFDMYLQAVFGHVHPKHYDMTTPNMRVIEYSKDSAVFWRSFRHFIRFASQYQWWLNEDLVMVIQNGGSICDEIVSCLERKRGELRYKYSLGPANCFILTIASGSNNIASQGIVQGLISESGLASIVNIGGAYTLYLRLHSMLEICTNIFLGEGSTQKAKSVFSDKNSEEICTKVPDNCVFPSFLPMVQAIQGAQVIPTLIVETGTDNGTKVEVGCISTILGVKFMVESVLGINLQTDESSRKLDSMNLIVFDVSIRAMLHIFRSLDNEYQKGLVSIVLKRKAQFKLDEVRAIRQLKECIDGNGNYKSLCDNIAKIYRLRMEDDPLQYLHAPLRPDKDEVSCILERFGFKRADLLSEETYYQNVIDTCDDAWKMAGQQLNREKGREAEAFMMQQLYRQRTVQTVTSKTKQDIAIPGTALSSTYWWGKPKVTISADKLGISFTIAAMECAKPNLEGCVIEVETPWNYLREESHAAVALLNCPDDVPEEAALDHLKQLYNNRSQKGPKIKTKLEHWTNAALQLQLAEWNVPNNGNRYGLMVKLLDRYTEKYESPDHLPNL